MNHISKLRVACIACAALGMSADGAGAANKNNVQIHRAWIPGKNKLPNLSSQSNGIAIEHIKLRDETERTVPTWTIKKKK